MDGDGRLRAPGASDLAVERGGDRCVFHTNGIGTERPKGESGSSFHEVTRHARLVSADDALGPMTPSVAEVDVLERKAKIECFDRGDDFLEIIAFLALNTQLVALNLDLYFEFHVPDLLR